MAIIKCKMCGGDLNVVEDATVCECEYCGTKQTVPKVDDEKKLTLFARAGRLLRACEFDKAAGVFETIVADFPDEAEAYWGLVLCKYGIEYVDDPATGKKIPTCHRSSFDSVMKDANFEQACENTDAVARRVYRDEARAIEELRKGIIEVSDKEEPYDVFISYKEKDANGERTKDSVVAQEIYRELTREGYRVFFSRISLEDKLGVEYEPYIFAALNSARVMLVVGTDYENFDAVWVKNEWSRYLKLIAKGERKTLIPVFRDMDAYDMPEEFNKLTALDMGKVGAVQDLVHGVEKIVGKKKTEPAPAQQVVSGGPNTDALLQRGMMALEDRDWDGAKGYFDRVLDSDAKNANAYLGLFMAEVQAATIETLGEKIIAMDSSPVSVSRNYERAGRFGSAELTERLSKWEKDRIEAKIKRDEIRTEEKRRQEEEELRRQEEERKRLEEEKRRKEEELCRVESEAEKVLSAIKYHFACKAVDPEIALNIKRRKLSTLNEIAGQFDELLQIVESSKKEISRLKERIAVLKEQRKALGVFSGKQKAQIDEEIESCSDSKDVLDRKKTEAEKKLGGFSTKRELEKKQAEVKSEVISLETTVAERDRAGYSYEEALTIFDTDSNVRERIISKLPWMALRVKDIGGTVFFGRYYVSGDENKEQIEWIILEKTGNRALLLSKYALDSMEFNKEISFKNITWEKCTLRSWLNTSFLDAAFSTEEQSMIQKVDVIADNNPRFSYINPGNSTTDKVFLLSISEVNQYLPTYSARACKTTEYVKTKQTKRFTEHFKSNISPDRFKQNWCLRSPGETDGHVVVIDSEGAINYSGDYKHGSFGVRPALWITID